MNSEVRELVKEMRAGTPCYVAKIGGGRCVNGAECLRCAEYLDWANRLERALLARTEAGAKCDHAWQPDSDVMNARYCPKCDVTQTIPKKTTRPQDASGDVVPVLFGRDADADWYVDAGTKSICVDVDFDPARQLSLILKQDGTVAWSIFVQEPDSSTTKATGPSVMNPGFYEALSYIAMQAKEAK